MKIRRILATAVAAAVTTPVLLLSAAPAFADTKPSPASTQKPPSDEDDFEKPSLDELRAAVALAQKEYDEAVVAFDQATKAREALDKPDHALRKAVTEAKAAAEAADAEKTAADEALAAAVQAEKDLLLLPEATEQQKADAAAAVVGAKEAAGLAETAAGAAATAVTGAEGDLNEAVAAADRLVTPTRKVKEAAAEDLAAAKEELAFFEEIGGDCDEDPGLEVALSGPKTVTAGQSAIFSLRVTNTSDRTMDAVDVFTNAARLPGAEEVLDEETGFVDGLIPVEWSSADNLEWTPVSEEFESIEVGKLAKGAHYDVKLRLTVAADAPVGNGVAFAYGEYENNDGSCGLGEEFVDARFGILAAKTDKPKPEPTPEPTPSQTTATPTPAPTVSTGGNGNTTQQGGSSRTPVTGTLAATGANENLTRLGLAAGAAVALGAGAMVVARRRKADASA
ncbi:peptidase [Streptomyces sp. NPDC058671]|uniref:peptidase n=1 Tax=unclassified Streptomyces TaxID=2593676 RepID=UPI003664606A